MVEYKRRLVLLQVKKGGVLDMKKRILAILLCLSLMGNILPLEVLAVKTQEQRQESPSHTFKDVTEGAWYYDSVMYAVDHKIIAQTSDDTFPVHAPMTRGMYVTILGRLANIGDSYAMKESLFKDVKPGAYYSQSISWAVDKGITRGIGNQNFGPDRPITREEMAIFTVRFFDIYNITYPEVKAKKAPADMEKITDYAKKEVLKFWNSGLLGGDEEGNFNPKKYASRAEVAAFSVRINKILLAAEEAKEKEKEEAEAKIDKESKEETKPSKKPNKEPDKKPPLNPGDEQEDTKSYSLTFNSNGGSNIKSKEFLSGSAMGELPIPYKDNKMFAGWYYDIALENRVLEKDVIKKDQVLYAKYSDIEPLAEAETPSFASALDQAPDFKLTVVSSKSMTSEEVKAGISYKNMSSQDEPRGIQVTGTGNVFTIAGQGGFEPGASYKFILEDEALQFQGFESSVRNYNFTIFKEEVLNLSLNQDLIYIPIKNIRNLTQEGEKVETVSRSTDLLDITEGSFEYDQPLQVGDSVTLYEGIRPDQRILNDTRPGADGNIAYIHITEVSGNRYSYKSEDIEEVLFKPDILPFENSLDKDGDPHNKSITANESDLVYSDDIYSPIQLDSQTTVDVGDYLAFYDGEFSANVEITEYGLITSVKDQDDQILVTYEKTSMDEILEIGRAHV